MDTVMDIGKKLNDPRLVVWFQRLCGILPACQGSAGCNSSETSGSVYQTVDTPNGDRNGVRKRAQNGHTVSELNDNHNQIKSNGSADGGEALGTGGSSSGQQCEVDYVIANKFLYYLFHFGASMGNEVFYITFFPYWFWNIDGYVGRRVCTFWCIFMYLGQAAKDIIKWPRPAAPPVVRLEKRYALEYSMPSTHAMVGAGLPVSLLILTHERYEYPFVIGLLICIIWCTLVCGSRLYLGMHTVLDVIAGVSFVSFLMFVCFPYLDAIDDFMLTHPYAPAVLVLTPLIAALCYPTLEEWNTARGDTTLILAVWAGVALGHRVCFQYGVMQRAINPPPYPILYPTLGWLGAMSARLALGVVILVATRTIMKLISYNLVCYLLGVSAEDQKAHRRLAVELPYKLVTYGAVAFNSVCLAPMVFRYLGIERETYFTEL